MVEVISHIYQHRFRGSKQKTCRTGGIQHARTHRCETQEKPGDGGTSYHSEYRSIDVCVQLFNNSQFTEFASVRNGAFTITEARAAGVRIGLGNNEHQQPCLPLHHASLYNVLALELAHLEESFVHKKCCFADCH
jgi:hypothetical protein